MEKKTKAQPIERSSVPAPLDITGYEDFVIVACRKDAGKVDVRVQRSPAGDMAQPTSVPFTEKEGAALRRSFLSAGNHGGRAQITSEEAAEIGKRLAGVLLPGPVFQLLAESIALTVAQSNKGLRIRLDLDASLVDLPWEYTYRPDRLKNSGISGFLLLDPAVSMVRQAANPEIRMEPIIRRQRLCFVGTLWEGYHDGWEVHREFALLQEGLLPVGRYIEPTFAAAGQASAFSPKRTGDAAIFHYAGHCGFDANGRAYLLRELPTTRPLEMSDTLPVETLASALRRVQTRLTVLSACNSGFWAAVQPLLEAGIPAIIGVNGNISSETTIEFCAKLYESLAVGLTLDEAVGRARLHVMEWGGARSLFDWGLFMVYMPSPDATLFQRKPTPTVTKLQTSVREDHALTIGNALQHVKELDGMNFGEIMSELSKRRVLILGRFTGRRLNVLNAIRLHLQEHPNNYIPELFTFDKPEARDLVESIIGFAALSRFIIADLSEPKSIQSELEAIVPHFLSVPVVPLINQSGKEFATFSSLQRRPNVVKPTVRYRNIQDLKKKIDDQVVPLAEKTFAEVKV